MKFANTITAIVLITLSLLTATSFADVKLPAVIADNMVLQQNKTITLWGWADPSESISVKPSWQKRPKKTKADKDGNWSINTKTPKASGPHTITITANNTITIQTVMTGEVWLCSGQSNMEWPMSKVNNSQQEIASAKFPGIRIFTVKNTISKTPLPDCTGSWSQCSPETVGSFSAVGYFFGRNIHQELNIPVGLISADWGGTPAESWTSAKTLKKMDDFALAVETLEQSDPSEIEKLLKQKMNQWQKQINEKDPGSKEYWQSPSTDDAEWKTMELPKDWTSTELASFDGVVWFRKTTNLPPSWSKNDMTITLGPIDDYDTLYVNGIEIGQTLNWSTPRQYTIPASALKTGKNTIAVRVIDLHGNGGIYGIPEQMTLKPTGAPDSQAVKLAGTWKYKTGALAKDVPAIPQTSPSINAHTPTSLYNGMIAPLTNYGIAGAIWYQGESNAARAYQYRKLFPAMIEDWRDNFDQGNFPFYFVQIAPYSYAPNVPSEKLREAQFLTLKNTKNSGMAVTSDIGNIKDIHPRNKQDVGKRLALWALAKTYGKKDVVYSGPVYKKFKIQDSKIRLYFEYTDGGLVAKDGPLTDFTIAGTDKAFVPATATIDGDTIIVSSDKVPDPTAVRFAWSNTAEPNLFNGAGLPASSFRTDDKIEN